MSTKPLELPTSIDPVIERAQFFLDLELAELRSVIPQAKPADPKRVY